MHDAAVHVCMIFFNDFKFMLDAIGTTACLNICRNLST